MIIKLKFKVNPLFFIWLLLYITSFIFDWFITLPGIAIKGIHYEKNPIIVGSVITGEILLPPLFFSIYFLLLFIFAFLFFNIERIENNIKIFGIAVDEYYQWLRLFAVILLFYLVINHYIGFNSWLYAFKYI